MVAGGHSTMTAQGTDDPPPRPAGSLTGTARPGPDAWDATETGTLRGLAVHGHLRRQFLSSDRETRAALADLCGQLALVGLDEDDLGTLELILAEALNNVTEHAYGPEGGPVEVSLILLDGAGNETHVGSSGPNGRVLCEVRDYGRPMPPGGPPGPGLPLIAPPDHLPEGGFGWHIIRCLVSELTYERLGNSNRLRMEVDVNQPLSIGSGKSLALGA
jgi:serine/threonine-protein kinase RsbW